MRMFFQIILESGSWWDQNPVKSLLITAPKLSSKHIYVSTGICSSDIPQLSIWFVARLKTMLDVEQYK